MIDCLQDTRGRGIDREILYHFDAMLIWLGSALDSTAHIANRAHQLGLHNHLVGWRRDPFRRALAVKAPRLHAITETGTPLRAVIDLIAAFRNTVHGEPLSGITYSSGGGEERGLVQLPTDAEAQATAATAPLGGRDLWGFVREGDAIVPGIWDPFVFVQVLLPFAAGALNALMETTDVEALPGVDAAKLRRNAPSNGFFEPDEVRKFALLHGLSAQVAIANG
jgi:hypothetical protein